MNKNESCKPGVEVLVAVVRPGSTMHRLDFTLNFNRLVGQKGEHVGDWVAHLSTGRRAGVRKQKRLVGLRYRSGPSAENRVG